MIEKLYELTQKRVMPEVVATELLKHYTKGPVHDKLRQVARHVRYYSSMSDDFRKPEIHLETQLALFSMIFNITPPSHEEAGKAAARELENLGQDPAGHRQVMSKHRRHLMGFFKNARQYNKRVRLLYRIIDKVRREGRSEELALFTRISKSALAVQIPYQHFAASTNTAALIAYMTARMNRRSIFTNKSQDRAFDEVSEALLGLCKSEQRTNWFAIAHVMPDASVIARLTDEQKGFLVGRWYALLQRMASRLQEAWDPATNRQTMVVRRGNDSSTWNAVAGAWNIARAHWISLTYAMSGNVILAHVCPGKVMRLMAADVARWHEYSGGGLHPDTHAWSLLPLPWDVLQGKVNCGLLRIAAACKQAGADYESWSYKHDRQAVPFKATPELVHGVEVASPDLALLLRKAGVFSGKSLKGYVPEVEVIRDEHGAAILTVPKTE